jgi:hypothetical protein
VGIFEFILLIALISTAGKVLTERRQPRMPPPQDLPALPPQEVERMREAVEELAERVGRLEEERDFYRELLDSPGRRESLGPGEGPPSGRSG